MVVVGDSRIERMKNRIEDLELENKTLKGEVEYLVEKSTSAYELILEAEEALAAMASMQHDQSKAMAATLRGLTAWKTELETEMGDESDADESDTDDTVDTEEYLYGDDE